MEQRRVFLGTRNCYLSKFCEEPKLKKSGENDFACNSFSLRFLCFFKNWYWSCLHLFEGEVVVRKFLLVRPFKKVLHGLLMLIMFCFILIVPVFIFHVSSSLSSFLPCFWCVKRAPDELAVCFAERRVYFDQSMLILITFFVFWAEKSFLVGEAGSGTCNSCHWYCSSSFRPRLSNWTRPLWENLGNAWPLSGFLCFFLPCITTVGLILNCLCFRNGEQPEASTIYSTSGCPIVKNFCADGPPKSTVSTEKAILSISYLFQLFLCPHCDKFAFLLIN